MQSRIALRSVCLVGLAALWSSVVIATVNWKDPSAEERKIAMSELELLRHIFRHLEHKAWFS